MFSKRAVIITFIIIWHFWRALLFKVLPHLPAPQSLRHPVKCSSVFSSALCSDILEKSKDLPKVTHVNHTSKPHALHLTGDCISLGPIFLPLSSSTHMDFQHTFWLVFSKALALLFLPAGGRDKRGGPILTFPARSNHDRIRQEDLRKLVTYLASVPR